MLTSVGLNLDQPLIETIILLAISQLGHRFIRSINDSGSVYSPRSDSPINIYKCPFHRKAIQPCTFNCSVKLALSKPKDTTVIASRRTTSTSAQSIRQPSTCTVIVANLLLGTNEVRKPEQMIHEITGKISLMEPVVARLLSLTYLTKTRENVLPEHLAIVCRTTNSISSETAQRNLRASDVVAFNVPDGILSDSFKDNPLRLQYDRTPLP